MSIPTSTEALRCAPAPQEDTYPAILGYADLSAIQGFACASKTCLKVTLQTTPKMKELELHQFIDHLITRLPEGGSHRTSLMAIRSSLGTEFPHLLAVKEALVSVKEQVIDILKTLNAQTLKALETPVTPSFFENIFQIAELCRQAASPIRPSDKDLSNLCKELAEIKAFREALQVAATISAPPMKDAAIQVVVINLTKTGASDKAIKVAQTLLSSCAREEAFYQIIHHLITTSQFEQAVMTAHYLPEWSRKEALTHLFSQLVHAHQIDKAIDLAKNILKMGPKHEALHGIIYALIDTDNFEEIDKVASLFEDRYTAQTALCRVSCALSHRGKITEAVDRAATVTYADLRYKAFQEILISLAKTGESERAILLTRTYLRDSEQDGAFQVIAETLAKAGYIPAAREIAEMISEECSKSATYKNVANSLIGTGHLRTAIDIANTKLSKTMCLYTLKDISDAFVESGRFEEAIALTEAISDDSFSQSAAREKIVKALLEHDEPITKAKSVAATIQHSLIKEGALYEINLKERFYYEQLMSHSFDITPLSEEALSRIIDQLPDEVKSRIGPLSGDPYMVKRCLRVGVYQSYASFHPLYGAPGLLNADNENYRKEVIGNTHLTLAIANAFYDKALAIIETHKHLPGYLDTRGTLGARHNLQNTALHLVIGKGYTDRSKDGEPLSPTGPELARLLLSSGANPNIQDYYGHTPLHFAYLHRNQPLIQLLKEAGAREDITNFRGENPKDYATKSLLEAHLILAETLAVFLVDKKLFEPPF